MKAFVTAFLLTLAAPAFAQQTVPEIAFDSVADFPKLPEGMNFGEVPGVAVDSKGNVYVDENRGKRVHKFRIAAQ